jgi:hypothetical protein
VAKVVHFFLSANIFNDISCNLYLFMLIYALQTLFCRLKTKFSVFSFQKKSNLATDYTDLHGISLPLVTLLPQICNLWFTAPRL